VCMVVQSEKRKSPLIGSMITYKEQLVMLRYEN
jgi:hypothetical protein